MHWCLGLSSWRVDVDYTHGVEARVPWWVSDTTPRVRHHCYKFHHHTWFVFKFGTETRDSRELFRSRKDNRFSLVLLSIVLHDLRLWWSTNLHIHQLMMVGLGSFFVPVLLFPIPTEQTHPSPVRSDLRELTYTHRVPWVSSSSCDDRRQSVTDTSPDIIPRICSPSPSLLTSWLPDLQIRVQDQKFLFDAPCTVDLRHLSQVSRQTTRKNDILYTYIVVMDWSFVLS